MVPHERRATSEGPSRGRSDIFLSFLECLENVPDRYSAAMSVTRDGYSVASLRNTGHHCPHDGRYSPTLAYEQQPHSNYQGFPDVIHNDAAARSTVCQTIPATEYGLLRPHYPWATHCHRHGVTAYPSTDGMLPRCCHEEIPTTVLNQRLATIPTAEPLWIPDHSRH